MAHFSGCLASQEGRYFSLWTHWDSGFLVGIFLIVEILYGVKRFLTLWVWDLGTGCYISLTTIVRSCFTAQFPFMLQATRVRETYHLHVALSWTFRAQGDSAFSKGMKLNSPQPTLLDSIDLEHHALYRALKLSGPCTEFVSSCLCRDFTNSESYQTFDGSCRLREVDRWMNGCRKTNSIQVVFLEHFLSSFIIIIVVIIIIFNKL